jgi:hypothetical protein
MKGIILILLLVIVLPGIVMAVEYDLNDYELPDYYDQDLDIWLDMNGSVSNSEFLTGRDQEHLSSDIELEYKMEKFRRELLLSVTGNLVLEKSGESMTYQDSVNSGLDYDLQKQRVDIDFLLRRYLRNKWYGQSSLEFSYRHTLNKSVTKNVNLKRDNEFDANIFTADLRAGLGYGRREDASSACSARQILQELEAAGLLARECLSGDVKILGDELIRLETLSLFDSRELRKERYRQLWQKLTEMHLVESADIESFVILQDLYELTGMFERETGWEITPEIYCSKQYRIDDNDIKIVDYETVDIEMDEFQDYEENIDEYGIGISGSYARILGLNWQLGLNGNIYYYNFVSENDRDKRFVSYSEDIYDDLIKQDYEGYKYDLEAGLNWYPDTRTEFWSSARVEYNHLEGDSSIEETDEAMVKFKTDIREEYYYFAAGINYYFTPKLNTTLGIGYTIKEYTGQYGHAPYSLGVDERSFNYAIYVMYHLF